MKRTVAGGRVGAWMEHFKGLWRRGEGSMRTRSDMLRRTALKSDQQLLEHARTLAHELVLLAAKGNARNLIGRLESSEVMLSHAFHVARQASQAESQLEPAGEWLVDNYYLLEGHFREARAGLAEQRQRRLPMVAQEEGGPVPRMLALMRELVAYADGRVPVELLQKFLAAYQQGSYLTLPELWAVPLMLRLAVLEYLGPIAAGVQVRLAESDTAARFAAHLVDVARTRPSASLQVLAEQANAAKVDSPTWLSEFHRHVQPGHADLRLAQVWLEQQLAARQQSIGQVQAAQSQTWMLAQLSTSHCINTLRRLGHINWASLVDALSVVENILRRDPAQVYGGMSVVTRNQYRDAVAFCAEHSSAEESAVAEHAIGLAAGAVPSCGGPPVQHVGYWLVGAGYRQLACDFRMRLSPHERVACMVQRFPSWFYLMPIIAITLVTILPSIPAIGDFGLAYAAGVALLLVIAVSQLSIAIVNWAVALDIPTRVLPRLDFSDGVPDHWRTLVVVPCLLTRPVEVAELVSRLEIHYVGNRDSNVYFGLLADFSDGADQVMPTDGSLLSQAVSGIEALNSKYAVEGVPRFFLFYRDRMWNRHEGVWMGWERKRGKLIALNRFLRGQEASDFHLCAGDAGRLRTVSYVITLDADTELPPDAAKRLIATLSHPLNRPVRSAREHRVVSGYAVLQPRVSVGASLRGASRLAHLYSEEIALDPYTGAAPNSYQDLYGETSFIGKGIYDIDAFMWAVGERFPDNRVLSHDFIEGSYARTGLVSDIELFERHPDNYSADMSRHHRWTRGDWQIGAWLLPWVPGSPGRWLRNTLTLHQRLKLLDNLRRSLVPAAMLLLLLHGWLVSAQPVHWTALVLVFAFAPPLLIAAQRLLARNPRTPWRLHFRLGTEAAARLLAQAAVPLVMLPFEAGLMLDAIGRSVWRLTVSKKKLLEWTTASAVARRFRGRCAAFYGEMWLAPVLAAAVGTWLAMRDPQVLFVAAPWMLSWAAAPLLAWWLSLPARYVGPASLEPAEQDWLGMAARRTWHFFDTFVSDAEHALPPDNFQEYLRQAVAHRTSPTNIGMYLTGILSAFDFGYITRAEMHRRAAVTLSTLEHLDRYHGHFFNWYDTHSLAPLRPIYVSSVDSGNFLACSLTLARGLEELPQDRLFPAQVWRGLADTWSVVCDLARCKSVTRELPGLNTAADECAAIEALLTRPPPADAPVSRQIRALKALARHLQNAVAEMDETGEGAQAPSLDPGSFTAGVETRSRLVIEASKQGCQAGRDASSEKRDWVLKLLAQCNAWMAGLRRHAPWAFFDAAWDVGAELVQLRECLDANPTLGEAIVLSRTAAEALTAGGAGPERALAKKLYAAAESLQRQVDTARALAARARALCDAEFDLLYDPGQKLLAIGYDVDNRKRDDGVYDLLASESRLASFVAIAQGKLPLEHWIALGRPLTAVGDGAVLVSWGGTMFEYLMPLLLTPGFENTLLTRSCRNVVDRQIEYGREQGVPWGISESAYNVTDSHYIYQYRAFGVPGLGFKRDLDKDKVVAPYASALALLLHPHAACSNLREFETMGALGRYGFYEALDFTPERLPENAPFALVRCFMAHHQGMVLAALSSALNGFPLQRRFLQEPMFRAYQLLLQEKVPATISIDASVLHAETRHAVARELPAPPRVFKRVDTVVPEIQLLSNGRWHVFVSQAGGGQSRWNDLAANRWDQDGVCDASGIFCYVQDLDSGTLWSNTWQPTLTPADEYTAIFAGGSAEFRRRDGDIETCTRVAVSSEDDVELRRLTVINHSHKRRRIALTSYLELALAQRVEAMAHPVFDKLFVKTEFVEASQAILAVRRARSREEHPPTFFHLMSGREFKQEVFSYETRRDVFIGRTGHLAAPAALRDGRPLSGGTGASLDPIASVRREFILEPGQTRTVDIVTGAASQRETALALAARYADRHLAERVLDLARTHAQMLNYQLGIGAGERDLFASLANAALFIRPEVRGHVTAIERLASRQSALWKLGMSGDLPIILVRIGREVELPLVRQAIQLHSYWRIHGLSADLAVWVENLPGYRQDLNDRVMELITANDQDVAFDRRGGVFVCPAAQLSPDDRAVLLMTACLVLDGRNGRLSSQFSVQPLRHRQPGRAVIPAASQPADSTQRLAQPADWQGSNGMGGWSADGREYQVWLTADRQTPLPWANVLANPQFGSVVSESGGAYTWSRSAHEFRLTPWINDPVTDASEEAFYVRDQANGYYWSPTPMPVRGPEPYLCTHGFGYSRFETIQADIACTLTTFVAREHSVKFSVLRLRNLSKRPRKLAAFGYVGWVLGEHRCKTAPHVLTHCDLAEHVISASNPFNDTWSGEVGWFAVGVAGAATGLGDTSGSRGPAPSATGSRIEFIGRNQNLRQPRALRQRQLNHVFGASADPCGAWQIPLELAPGAECELVFLLGSASDRASARALAQEWASPQAAAAELVRVRDYWSELLGRVSVQTPDPAMNLIMNGWLVYQVVVCRLWGRSGYYQSGGAFGFRDQLQDAIALLAVDPARAHTQILLCAAHQFEQGDVLHWWHPPLARGVRTRSSDDCLWLPWAISEYVQTTGDAALLGAEAPFLQGRLLEPGETSYYDVFTTGELGASLYDHCTRAIEHALRLGVHGLPLIGSGDWNDGMDRVGANGRGESVWLGFFLALVLRRFVSLAQQRGDIARAERYATQADGLAHAIEAEAWDGRWYRRAYTDDGVPLGSASNSECQIDSLPQSWSVLADVGDPRRQRQAIDAVMGRLVHESERVVQLFDPPFDDGELEPGYIKGYTPGTRENGGQYTHAAIWLGMALAKLGRNEQAWHVFDLLNPVRHAQTAEQVERYKGEPYVVAADVYWEQSHRGQCGWSWYTGSAAWLHRFGLESILGFRLQGDIIHINPCIPASWPGYHLRWCRDDLVYDFECTRVQAQPTTTAGDAGLPGLEGEKIEADAVCSHVRSIVVDGSPVSGCEIPLANDHGHHVVRICVGASPNLRCPLCISGAPGASPADSG